jgi:hypothetical protein
MISSKSVLNKLDSYSLATSINHPDYFCAGGLLRVYRNDSDWKILIAITGINQNQRGVDAISTITLAYDSNPGNYIEEIYFSRPVAVLQTEEANSQAFAGPMNHIVKKDNFTVVINDKHIYLQEVRNATINHLYIPSGSTLTIEHILCMLYDNYRDCFIPSLESQSKLVNNMHLFYECFDWEHPPGYAPYSFSKISFFVELSNAISANDASLVMEPANCNVHWTHNHFLT